MQGLLVYHCGGNMKEIAEHDIIDTSLWNRKNLYVNCNLDNILYFEIFVKIDVSYAVLMDKKLWGDYEGDINK